MFRRIITLVHSVESYWHFNRPSIKHALNSALRAIDASPATQVKCIGRQSKSVILFAGFYSEDTPNGIFIKIAINKKREATWDVQREFENLTNLTSLSRALEFVRYIKPLAHSSTTPCFLVLPFVPGATLRQLLYDTKNRAEVAALHLRLAEGYLMAGRWLGVCYRLSTSHTSNVSDVFLDLREERAFCFDRISEIQEHSPLQLDCERLKKHIDSLLNSDDYPSIRRTRIPRLVHGDFTPSNVILDSSNRWICPIDPEPRGKIPATDFVRFCQFTLLDCIWTQHKTSSEFGDRKLDYLSEFLDGVAQDYENLPFLAYSYLRHVLATVAWHFKQGNIKHRRPTIQGLRLRHQQRKLIYFWCDWLERIPSDPKYLWNHMKWSR